MLLFGTLKVKHHLYQPTEPPDMLELPAQTGVVHLAKRRGLPAGLVWVRAPAICESPFQIEAEGVLWQFA